ncbi:hypothetical protein DFR29_113190 [Tahibacter aquaticus]|uniref:Tyr recombinase domain-containing protein n=1 Tax=Tahibacter aquaticus TaxID=520092 RepID=A0A4R6YRB2_9GAMM|nr:site-specific integrase [Tahibacter aquaticus]TDR40488.1 hypothetical protein DFR29_113190 [Tahibacter aquaticus]
MRFAHHLVLLRSGIFYFRQRVPVELQPVLGIRFVQHSLRTRDARTAKVCSYTLSVRYAETFAALKDTVVPKLPPSIQSIVSKHEAGDTRRFEIDVDPASLRPTRLKTNGTEQDNRAALDVLRLLAQPAMPAPHALTTPRPASAASPPVPPKPPGLTLRQAIVLYTEAESAGLKRNTWAQRQRAFASFSASVGKDMLVSAIDREAVGEWAHGVIVAGAAKQAGPAKKKGATKRTVGNMVSHVAQLFAFLGARGKLLGPNPVNGAVVFTKKEKAARKAEGFQWEPLDLTALQLIYKPENLARIRTEHARWAPLIGLYTGARVSEIAQLYLADFVEEQGIPCLRITTDSDGQSLKTAASRRLVPIHPDLVELGLLDRVERLRREGKARLFPDMRIDSKAGAGNAISKGFGYYLDKLGIRPRRSNGIVGFHSLRKTVIQELQGSRLLADRRRAFVGHEPGDDVHQVDYMRPWTAEELSELFPGLRWKKWLEVGSLRVLLT